MQHLLAGWRGILTNWQLQQKGVGQRSSTPIYKRVAFEKGPRLICAVETNPTRHLPLHFSSTGMWRRGSTLKLPQITIASLEAPKEPAS